MPGGKYAAIYNPFSSSRPATISLLHSNPLLPFNPCIGHVLSINLNPRKDPPVGVRPGPPIDKKDSQKRLYDGVSEARGGQGGQGGQVECVGVVRLRRERVSRMMERAISGCWVECGFPIIHFCGNKQEKHRFWGAKSGKSNERWSNQKDFSHVNAILASPNQRCGTRGLLHLLVGMEWEIIPRLASA
jgi:hypothetical protein